MNSKEELFSVQDSGSNGKSDMTSEYSQLIRSVFLDKRTDTQPIDYTNGLPLKWPTPKITYSFPIECQSKCNLLLIGSYCLVLLTKLGAWFAKFKIARLAYNSLFQCL